MPTAHAMAPQPAPDRSSTVVVTLDDLENDVVRTGANYWCALRAGGRLPARSQLSPRDMAGLLKHLVLVKVIDGGRDFEYRITGDAQVQAYGFHFQNMRVSHIEAAAPEFGRMMRGLYETVRASAAPFAVRGWVGRDVPDARFVYYESVFLPLAEDGVTVDHIVVVSLYVPRAP